MNDGDDNGSIPESFNTNSGLKLRVVWTISSLIAASARHYMLGCCMNKEQLELRVKPLSTSKRTLVLTLNMKLWYAAYLELPNGSVLKEPMLVAIRPSEQAGQEVSDGSWVSSAFEEPHGTAATMLVKRTYCLEMNSF
ncbi:putative F-box protein AUF1 [Helianthus debilis subsp. tardiflorus]